MVSHGIFVPLFFFHHTHIEPRIYQEFVCIFGTCLIVTNETETEL